MSVKKTEPQLMYEVSFSLKRIESAVESMMESCDRDCINEVAGILAEAVFSLNRFKRFNCSCGGQGYDWAVTEQEASSSPVESVRIPRPSWAKQVGESEVRS